MRTTDPDITSTQIINECEKRHGHGKLFFRTDGFEFEPRRVALRNEYLQSHSAIEPKHREAILNAAATPGMTRDEVTAAWGLLEEDTRMAFGNVTDGVLAAFAYFNGFRVGHPYTIYLRDDVVVGITDSVETVPPHEWELTMRLAEEYKRMRFFYPGKDGALAASDVDQVHIDWDTLHLHLYTIEQLRPYPFSRVEQEMRDKAVMREYELTFLRQGFDSWNATEELRWHTALSVLPYPAQKGITTPERQPAVSGPIALPASEFDPENRDMLPPDEWFAHVEAGADQEATFINANGDVELVKVERIRDRMFRVAQVPLWVNEACPYDLVELEWQGGETIPRFKRLIERRGRRTIRAIVNDQSDEKRIRRFAELNRGEYRYEQGVLVFTILQPKLDAIAKEWLTYLALTWIYTDTLSQE